MNVQCVTAVLYKVSDVVFSYSAWEQVQRATKSVCRVARSLGCGGSPNAFNDPNDEEKQ